MNCIRTGAVVNFVEYGTNTPCDLFKVGTVIVAKFYPQAFHAKFDRNITHEILISSSGILDETRGFAVVPEAFVSEVRRD